MESESRNVDLRARRPHEAETRRPRTIDRIDDALDVRG